MEIIVRENAEIASKQAGKYIANKIRHANDIVLGLATGGTPVKMYNELVRQHKEEGLSFAKVSSFNLDEYIGLTGDHDQSYRYFMNDNLFNHVDIDKSKTRVPNGMAEDIPTECAAYEEDMKNAGGVALQVLGLGTDGHIGFNEPGSSLASRTRIKTLTKQTCEDNARFFNSIAEVPIHCITMGIGTIMEAEEIVLLAFGEGKADVIKEMVEGAISAECPATILQMHPNVKIFIDDAAAAKLTHLEYHKYVYNNKPAWQQF